MSESSTLEPKEILERIHAQVRNEQLRVTQHAQQEMVEEDVTLAQVLEAILSAQILENYPEHQRGPCCLIYGATNLKRDLHIVCTTAQELLIIITVYEPKHPKWLTPTERNRQ